MKKTLLFSRLIAIGLMMLFSSGWAVGQTLIISEVTDPGDNYKGKFVEIYNATDAEIDFDAVTWYLSRQANGGTVNDILLTGTIASGSTYVIAGFSDFLTIYGFAADLTSGTVSGNGDDGYFLYSGSGYATGTLIDSYGVIDEDGSGKDWEYENTRAVRNSNITSANTTWTSSEWTIDASADVADCAPGEHTCDLPASGAPVITISTSALDDFFYEFGNGPSAEQSFTVEGADLTADITLTPPTNYEISTGTGGSFSATNPITLSQSGGAVAETTIYTRLKAGLAIAEYNAEDVTAASTDATSKNVACSGYVYSQLDWWNLQWPATGAITRGGDHTVYAQVYEAGLTDPAGQGAGITAWIGYSTSDTNPSTWTNWVATTYNGDSGNNDEYMANIGTAIAAPGVYYYASRFQLGSAPYVYGGYNGGAWDGATNVSGVLTVTGVVSIVLNEVDADTEGTDVLEFIELYDGGIGNTALDGLVLVLHNGSDDASYDAYDLDTYSTDVDGYFVIGNTAVANVDIVASSNFLQNGADAVALYYGDDTDFPNDTPVTTTNLIDAIVYGTDDSDDAALLVLLNASQPQVDEGVWPARETVSSQRFPNGSGGTRNTDTYIQALPSPGETNNGDNVWTGATDNDYTNTLNWTNGTPTAGHNVTIPVVATVYPTVIASTAGYCNNLEIVAGAVLYDNNGGTLVVSGDVIIQSDATNSGSILGPVYDASYSAKTVTYNRYVTGGQWHLMGASFEGQDIGDLIDAAGNAISFMKDYNTGTDAWNADFSGATEGTMTSGEGYAIKRSTDGVISISGIVPSNPNVTLDKTGNGWNLLGNPYASAVYATDPGGLGTSYLLNATNVGSMATGFEALYVWEENVSDPTNTNNYKTVNSAGSGDLNKISPQVTHLQAGQGFFVKASATATTFDFSISMQDHQSTLSLYKEEAVQWPTVTINAEISNAKASTTVTYNSMMTKGLDKTYDAGLLNSYPEFALYSRLVEDYEGIDFMLQALPEDYDNLIIPIGLDAKAGEIITFTAKTLNIPEGYVVIIEDRAMNTFTNLSDGGEYVVQLDNDSDGTGRFFVRTSIESTLGLGDLDAEKAFQVFTRVNDYQLVIRGEAIVNTVARIYSITGQQVATVNLKQATEQNIPFNEESGVYIVQITNDQGTYTQKFSWVK